MRILDLGIGTGLTTWYILKEFPNSYIDGIDFSSEMLKRASERMGKFNSRVKLIEADFTRHEFNGKYDVIFSAVIIHNLLDDEKKKLFFKIYNHLNEDGYFINADFIKFKSDYLTRKTMEFYEEFVSKNLAGKELEHWLKQYKRRR